LEKANIANFESEEDNVFTVDETMARQVCQALQKFDARTSGPRGAARLLGINPNTLRSRMRKLGISFKYF